MMREQGNQVIFKVIKSQGDSSLERSI
eukprot:UN05432